MLQLATPHEPARPAILASIGIHALAVSAMSFVPLLAFPLAPFWPGEVWIVTQPVLSVPHDVKPVDLRGPAPEARPSRGPSAGGPPAAPREGPPPEPSEPTVQPTSMLSAVAAAPDVEPGSSTGVPGGEDETGIGTGPGTGTGVPNGDPDAPFDGRAGTLPPDLVLPVPVDTPAPRYPDIARIVRKEGVVVLSATIAADGSVVDLHLDKGMGPLLDQAALDAVSRWRYLPARIGDRRVAVILRVTLTFRLL